MYDTEYVKAEQAYRAARIRDQLIGRRQRRLLRAEAGRRRKERSTEAW
jgi:hypothetical protein